MRVSKLLDKIKNFHNEYSLVKIYNNSKKFEFHYNNCINFMLQNTNLMIYKIIENNINNLFNSFISSK